MQTPIRIMQMDCPTEEGLLRSKLGGMPGLAGLAAMGSEVAEWTAMPTWVFASLALAAV